MRKFWTKSEEARLRRLYPNRLNAYIAALMGRTEPAIMQKAIKLGLRKSESVRLANCFRKGGEPWNKGKPHNPPGSEVGRFEPGNKPWTWLPVGTERVEKEGILMRKVSDTGNRRADWRPVHVLKWERYRGPVPKGHIVVFLDGDKRNFAIGNLECITRAENMRRNSVHNLPKELADLVQLVGALNRQINARVG